MTARAGTAITGVGDTAYQRRGGPPPLTMAVAAIRAAVADAGLRVADVDGLVSYPGHVESEPVITALGLPDVAWRSTTSLGGAGAVADLAAAAAAIEAGQARVVVVFRASANGSGPRKAQRASHLPAPGLRAQLETTHGWNTPAQRYALLAQRYIAEHGLARAQLAECALAARFHAGLNPHAQLHDRPLARADYLQAPIVADPFNRFDCCLETDGACAVVLTAADHPTAGGSRAVRLLAATTGHPATPDDLTNRPSFLDTGVGPAARRAWASAGRGPADIDVALLYDCFTFEVVHQLEESGFCAPGTAGAFIEAGNIRLGGRLPVNPHGGLLAEGHLAGLNHVVEAVRQLRHEAGARQVPGARHASVTGFGNLGDGSFAILGGPHA